jgi:TolA-binding protein
VDEYPNSQHAAKALKYIRTIYVDMGDIDAYTRYVQGLSNVEVSMNSLDSASYEAGANAVEAGNCAKAIDAFDKYIRNFPRGVYLLDANHYKAECHYAQKEYNKALPHYQYIYRQRKNMYTENALNRAAFILEQQADSIGLIEVYTLMEESAESPDVLKRARTGLMRNYYKTGNCEKTIEYAKKVLTYDKLNEYVEEEAHYYQAVCYLKQNLLEEALAEYKKVYSLIPSEFDIEAAYQIGEILFHQQKYKDAEKHLRAAIKTMGSDKHRLALSFILLSDIYVAMDDLPQAKSMLNTVINRHDGQDLINLAKEKLEAILARERQQNQRRFEQQMETND